MCTHKSQKRNNRKLSHYPRCLAMLFAFLFLPLSVIVVGTDAISLSSTSTVLTLRGPSDFVSNEATRGFPCLLGT